jgi:hypothetical protein
LVVGEYSTYPSIYWNPWNPIFACDDPTINVRIGDTINFLCPTDQYKFYIPPTTDVNNIYENLWFLDDEKQFDNCNATFGRQLLRCDGGQNSRKHYTISFRDVVTSANAIEFEKGKTYYLVGTGYRTLDKLDDRVGGSCNSVSVKDQFKLRLKIKVCKDDERCDICKTDGCYYQSCGRNCTPWVVHRSVPTTSGGCLKIETRTCLYPYLDEKTKTEYRETNQSTSECVKQIVEVGKQTGEILCDSSSDIFKVLFVISVAILFFLLLFFLCYKRCCVSSKEGSYDAEFNHQAKDAQALNGCNNPVGKTNPAYRNSTKLSIHLPKIPSFRHTSNKSPTKVPTQPL